MSTAIVIIGFEWACGLRKLTHGIINTYCLVNLFIRVVVYNAYMLKMYWDLRTKIYIKVQGMRDKQLKEGNKREEKKYCLFYPTGKQSIR